MRRSYGAQSRLPEITLNLKDTSKIIVNVVTGIATSSAIIATGKTADTTTSRNQRRNLTRDRTWNITRNITWNKDRENSEHGL